MLRNMRKFISGKVLVLALISVTHWGCSKDDNILHIEMSDGNTVVVNTHTKFYDSEDAFLHSVSFRSTNDYQVHDVEEIDYEINCRYSLVGYSQINTECWEMAKFGSWATKYGLSPNTVYYVATDIFAKYISAPQEGLMIVPDANNVNMGYCPGINSPTFMYSVNDTANVCILQTGSKCVKYDSNGIPVNLIINNLKKQLTWKFQILRDVWE